MAKNDNYYFDNFVNCIRISKEAAEYLKGVLENFDPDKLETQVAELHAIEHKGDKLKHALVKQVAKAFITPLEREDILKLSHTIDNVTDSIEDIVINLYMRNIRRSDESLLTLVNLLIDCCEATCAMLEEFRNFKKSKLLAEKLIYINSIEEQADGLYRGYMRQLHKEQSDALRILSWSKIYNYFERCFDACEDVAYIVESLIIENS